MGIINKTLWLLLVLCLIGLFIGCAKQTASYEPTYKDISIKTNSTDMKDISIQIMKKLFDEYKKDSVKKELKLKDYTINKIADLQGDCDKFNFSIDYSFEPFDMNSYIVAGNGAIKDSWVINKFAFVEVQKIGTKYKITSMGTGR